MKIILMSILSLYLASCAHDKQETTYKETISYSADVEKEFSLIEMEQQQALEYYRKLRQKNWSDYKSGTRRKYRRVTPKKYEESSSKPVQQKSKKPAKPQMSEEQIKEFEIEVGQNLTYFCMQKRKDRRFSDEADCQAFTQNALDECEQSVGVQYDRRVLKCLKKKLR